MIADISHDRKTYSWHDTPAQVLYSRVLAEQSEFRERRDCSVKALAIVTGVSYTTAHDILAHCGRRNRRGVMMEVLWRALHKLGFGRSILSYDEVRHIKTPITLARAKLQGVYLVEFRGHVLAYIDGQILDFYEGRRSRVENIYRIYKKDIASR